MSRPLTPPTFEDSTFDAPEIELHSGNGEHYTDSDSDTDDPEALKTKYLAFKKQLYDLRPDLAETIRKVAMKSSKRANTKAHTKDSDPRIAKLQRKLAEIESDILFDRDGAELQWVETQKDLAKEASERKRLQLEDNKPRVGIPPLVPPDTPLSTDSGDTNADVDDLGVDMLADLFSGTDVQTQATSLQDAASDDKVMTIRDFGKFNGLKPRRVLEEACKAR